MTLHQNGSDFTIGGLESGMTVKFEVEQADDPIFLLKLRASDLLLDRDAFEQQFLVPLRAVEELTRCSI